MEEIPFVLPGPPERRSGGTLYSLRLVRELGAGGLPVRLVWLSDRFPFPRPEDARAAERVFAELPAGAPVVVDGLVLGALPELAARYRDRLRLVVLHHHPISLEPGLPPEIARSLFAAERTALACARQVIVTSSTTRDLLIREFRVPFARLAVAPPGTDPAAPAHGSQWNPPQLLSVGALIPRKDHLGLVRALAQLADRPFRLDIVGSTTVDPATTRTVVEAIASFGLGDRVRLLGEQMGEALEACYARADLFVSASRFEGYGMALAEALARGLPIVAVQAGAVPEVVPETAGILVEPGHPGALAAAIARLLRDPALQARLRAGALAARQRLAGWQETAHTVRRLLTLAARA